MHVSAFVGVWAPVVLAVLFYPVVVDRVGLSSETTDCENCGAKNPFGTLVCDTCNAWLGLPGGYRWLLVGGLLVPSIALVVELVVSAIMVTLWVAESTWLGTVAVLLYPDGMWTVGAVLAVQLLFVTGGAYMLFHGITATFFEKRNVPFLS